MYKQHYAGNEKSQFLQKTPKLILDYHNHFSVIHQSQIGFVRQHRLVDTCGDDYHLVKNIAFEKAALGHKVDIMPRLNEHDEHRLIIFPDAKGFKSPDLRINGLLYEVEQPQNPTNLNSLKHRISEGASQADYVIIDLIKPINLGLIKRVCHSKFIDYEQLSVIEFRYECEYILYTREDFDTNRKSKKKPLI